MEHYSERLKRNFIDSDWLSVQEVKNILSVNRGKEISQEYAAHVAKSRGVEILPVGKRMHLYLYKDVKGLEVKITRGPYLSDNPSPGALRQRVFRQKRLRGLERRKEV